ncbi:MAG: Asp-tRNA(Asn)/Glu-tRNA(Gln) amidotransferase subunit GatB [Phototrophicaceae bacterium]|jgi:aspartyl-tRNA(Asn)/glutamyl-tRNA(Gln) amidotransferase subunit B
MSDWTTIVGLEVHAEMLTGSKMFSACPVVDSVEAAPNSAVDELSLGFPGTLPAVNALAMEYGLRVGLALGCEIPPFSQFARKSYFYPDLPKGYQISQYEHPLAVNGYLDIDLPDGTPKRIRVRRAHMEEDTGKLTHAGAGSLVDYNRAGVPLLEIVSEPDIRSSAEAESYARKLRAILRYLGVNHGDMSKGILRFEANVSVMHKDDSEFRQRTEIKNLNSIRSLARSIDYEAARQIKLYENGETVRSATLGWDENRQQVTIQRYKERADEYRYFPDPDLPIVVYTPEQVEAVRAKLVELPDAKKARFIEQFGLTAYDADVLVGEKAVADYYESAVTTGANPKSIANWILGSLFALMNTEGASPEDIASIRVTALALGELVKLVENKTVNKGSAEQVLKILWDNGGDPSDVVAREGLAQVSDTSAITAAIESVLASSAPMVARYKGGEEKVFGALMGQCMKALQGKGDPQVIREMLTARLQG